MLSVVSWFIRPFNATYAASKHAALAVSDAARIELRKQWVRGFHRYRAKVGAGTGCSAAIEGVESGLNNVLAAERAKQIYDAVRRDPEQLERTQQDAWDQ